MDSKAKILDIAMNLNRIGNWAADSYQIKRNRIIMFLDQTSEYLKSINRSDFGQPFDGTFNRFLQEYPNLAKEGKNKPDDVLYWAERMMTWGNILTHRSRLISE